MLDLDRLESVLRSEGKGNVLDMQLGSITVHPAVVELVAADVLVAHNITTNTSITTIENYSINNHWYVDGDGANYERLEAEAKRDRRRVKGAVADALKKLHKLQKLEKLHKDLKDLVMRKNRRPVPSLVRFLSLVLSSTPVPHSRHYTLLLPGHLFCTGVFEATDAETVKTWYRSASVHIEPLAKER
jgi:hypothetical protein